MDLLLNSGNPTKLRVGTTGQLQGRTYQVLGRVVLATADGYKWQEYSLRAANGEEATLVYESGDWKLFQLVEPKWPMTAAEAAQVRADNPVSVNGQTMTATYVGTSKVVYIEGTAPEGVELGDRSSFFNAEPATGRMLVVSWQGEEVELYEGRNVGEHEVVQGFGLPQANMFVRGATAFRRMELDLTQLLVGGAVVVFLLVHFFNRMPRHGPVYLDAPPKQAAPALHLPEKGVGRIAGHTYTVSGRALVAIAQPGRKFDRNEYVLVDEAGTPALLVQGLNARPDEWHLLLPASTPKNFTPFDAARVRVGRATDATDKRGDVVYLFQSNAQVAGGGAHPGPWPKDIQYGFVARTAEQWMLARWTLQELQVYQGPKIAAGEIAAAFHVDEAALGRP